MAEVEDNTPTKPEDDGQQDVHAELKASLESLNLSSSSEAITSSTAQSKRSKSAAPPKSPQNNPFAASRSRSRQTSNEGQPPPFSPGHSRRPSNALEETQERVTPEPQLARIQILIDYLPQPTSGYLSRRLDPGTDWQFEGGMNVTKMKKQACLVKLVRWDPTGRWCLLRIEVGNCLPPIMECTLSNRVLNRMERAFLPIPTTRRATSASYGRMTETARQSACKALNYLTPLLTAKHSYGIVAPVTYNFDTPTTYVNQDTHWTGALDALQWEIQADGTTILPLHHMLSIGTRSKTSHLEVLRNVERWHGSSWKESVSKWRVQRMGTECDNRGPSRQVFVLEYLDKQS